MNTNSNYVNISPEELIRVVDVCLYNIKKHRDSRITYKKKIWSWRKMSNTDLKVWIDDYIRQMEFEQGDEVSLEVSLDEVSLDEVSLEASLEEQECKGYLDDYYNLGVEHGSIEATLETLKLVRGRL